MKQAIAAGVVGLGLGGAGALLGTDDPERERDGAVQTVDNPELVLTFAGDYHPKIPFQPVDRLPQRPVNEILGSLIGEDEPVVSNPTDYNGYVIGYGTHLPGKYTFAFVNRRTLRRAQRYRFTGDAVFFDAQTNLISASIAPAGGAEKTPVSTTTPANETTEEVVVEATETGRDE